MNFCSIYKITNSINSKVYIGQTWGPIRTRFAVHKNLNKKGSIKLQNAFNKYGKDNFKIELVTLTHTQSCADYWEQYFIKKYDSISFGYNLKDGGHHGKYSAEAKRKMSLARQGMKLSEETKKNISESSKGKIFSQKTRERISVARTGILHTDVTKNKMSIVHKGKHHSIITEFKKGCIAPLKGRKRVIDEQGKIRYIKQEKK